MFDVAVKELEQNSKKDPGVVEQAKIITKSSESPSLKELRIPAAVGAIVQTPAASLCKAYLLTNLLSLLEPRAWELSREPA